MEFYSAYNTPPDDGIYNEEPTLTQQHFQDECDINLIMARATQSGELPPGRPTFYGDFTDVQDYQSALHKIQKANTEFMALPAHIRDTFHNDPAEFLAFTMDPNNKDQAISLGLIDAPPPTSNPVLTAAVPAGQPKP